MLLLLWFWWVAFCVVVVVVVFMMQKYIIYNYFNYYLLWFENFETCFPAHWFPRLGNWIPRLGEVMWLAHYVTNFQSARLKVIMWLAHYVTNFNLPCWKSSCDWRITWIYTYHVVDRRQWMETEGQLGRYIWGFQWIYNFSDVQKWRITRCGWAP